MTALLYFLGFHVHEWSRVWSDEFHNKYQVCVCCGKERRPKVEL